MCSDTFPKKASEYSPLLSILQQRPNQVNSLLKSHSNRTVVVPQLVEWSLLTPEVRRWNPVIGKIYIKKLLTVNCIDKMKRKKGELPGMAKFFKTTS